MHFATKNILYFVHFLGFFRVIQTFTNPAVSSSPYYLDCIVICVGCTLRLEPMHRMTSAWLAAAVAPDQLIGHLSAPRSPKCTMVSRSGL